MSNLNLLLRGALRALVDRCDRIEQAARALVVAVAMALFTTPAHALIAWLNRGESVGRQVLGFGLVVVAIIGAFIFMAGIFSAIRKQRGDRSDIENKTIFGQLIGGACLALAGALFAAVVLSVGGGAGSGRGGTLPF